MVDRVVNQQRYNQDHVRDRQYVMNYQDLLVALRIQSQVNHHHNLDRLQNEKQLMCHCFEYFVLPQRRCNELALALPEIFGG